MVHFHEPNATRDLRRLKALTRDEGQLRKTLFEQEARLFDLETLATLRLRVDDLLDTLAMLACDDDFWTRLESQSDILDFHENFSVLKELDSTAFASLLYAVGYKSPPRPDATELVDETLVSMTKAMSLELSQEQLHQRLRLARSDVASLVFRARRDILPFSPLPLHASHVRDTARTAGRAARWLIPTVIGVAGGVAVESILPGTGIGVAAGKGLASIAETVATHSAEIVVQHSWIPIALESEPTQHASLAEIDPVTIHLAATRDLIETAYERLEGYNPNRHEEAQRLVDLAAEHIHRLLDLNDDWPDLFTHEAVGEMAYLSGELGPLRVKISSLSADFYDRAARLQETHEAKTPSGQVIGVKQEQPPTPRTQQRYLGL